MNKIFLILCCFTFAISSMARTAQKMPSKFDVVVSFGSMASGPSSDEFLKGFIKKFKKKYGVTLTGYKAAGCGREGEFNILFSLSGWKSSLKKKFISELNVLVTTQEKKNKIKDEHSGVISVDYNKNKTDFSYCRGGIKIWK